MFQAVSMFFQQTCLRGTSEKGKDVINQSKPRGPRRCYSGDSHPNHRKNMGMPRDAYLLHESTRFTPLKTNMTGGKSLFSIGNASTHSWWIIQQVIRRSFLGVVPFWTGQRLMDLIWKSWEFQTLNCVVKFGEIFGSKT